MLKITTILLVVLVVFSAFWGCAIKTELDKLFENNFEGLSLPAVTEIKERGISKRFPYATFDKVWDSVITVLIQQGIIVRISKATGTIVTVTDPPLIVFVERAEPTTVYLYCMCSLYRAVDSPKEVTPNMSPDFQKQTAKAFLDRLATQVYADDKWKYLYKTEKE